MIAIALHLEPVVFLTLLAAAVIYIGVLGQSAERACIIAITIGSVATVLAMNEGPVWLKPEVGVFIVDLATLVAFVVIMARSTKFWPIWINALQLVAVMTHLARFVKPQTVPMAYAIAEQLWAYVMIAILLICVRQHQSKVGSAALSSTSP